MTLGSSPYIGYQYSLLVVTDLDVIFSLGKRGGKTKILPYATLQQGSSRTPVCQHRAVPGYKQVQIAWRDWGIVLTTWGK